MHLQHPALVTKTQCTELCAQVPAELFRGENTGNNSSAHEHVISSVSHGASIQWIITQLSNLGAKVGATTEKAVSHLSLCVQHESTLLKTTRTKLNSEPYGHRDKSQEADSLISSWWLPPGGGAAGCGGWHSLYIFLYGLDLQQGAWITFGVEDIDTHRHPSI